MSRDAARKLGRSPNGDHALVKRDSTGTVQMSQVATGSTNLSNTGNAAYTTIAAGTPNLVAFTSATITVQSGDIAASNTPFHLTINRDGSALTSTTISATGANVTLNTSATLTTPANAPSWTLSGDVAGGTMSNVSHTVSREDRWV